MRLDKAFSVAAPQLWNKLPIDISHDSDVDTFKDSGKDVHVQNYLCRLMLPIKDRRMDFV